MGARAGPLEDRPPGMGPPRERDGPASGELDGELEAGLALARGKHSSPQRGFIQPRVG